MSCKLLVVSDSHGSWQVLERIALREAPFSTIIHCGDGADDLSRFDIPGEAQILRVSGNVDRGRGYGFDRMVIETLADKKIMVTHGDVFRVDSGLDRLHDEAVRNQADLVCFGHTHIACHHNGPTTLFNPGPANRGCYGIILIENTIVCRHYRL